MRPETGHRRIHLSAHPTPSLDLAKLLAADNVSTADRIWEVAFEAKAFDVLAENAHAIATGYPEYWRRSGGYRLDRMAADGSFDLAALVTGSGELAAGGK